MMNTAGRFPRGCRLRGLSVAVALAAYAGTAQAAELPLSRVVLSTSGLAQFTHVGRVATGSTVDVAVRLDQVDDILKSLTVFDTAGAIGAVSLPGKAPLSELFRDLPFDSNALESARALLTALVGSEVEIMGPVSAKGRVFGVEEEKVALPDNGGTIVRHRLTLMTDTGLVQARLEDLTALRFSDPQTRVQIERALAGLAQNRAKNRRTLSINFLGDGTRDVAISYMVAAPVWKTAYRLVLPKDGPTSRLQGWAVLENLTGGDWNDIELVLVSGNPVAFHQPLYTAFFTDRVEMPVTASARLVPHIDNAEQRSGGAPLKPEAMSEFAPARQAARALARAPQAAAAMPAPPSAPITIGAAANAPVTEEAATQLLYRFPAKISLATGNTMMVPFVDGEIAATRTWLYQPETAPRHPLAAVRVRNTGDNGLPPGIVTTYEVAADDSVSFVGDAELPLLAKNASKFLTFALDAKTDIRRDDKGVIHTQLGKAVNGTLTLTTRSRRLIAYEITPPADEDRQIVIEEARAEGWAPAGETNVEATPTRFRYTVTAPKGQTTKANLVLERTDSQTVVLSTLGAEDMLARIRELQNESVALKDTVAKLAAIVNDINKAKAQRIKLDAERQKIADDQDRIRQNLQAVGQSSDLGRRYLDTLKSQEDRLAQIDANDANLEKDIAAKREAAEALARQLVL